MVISYAAKDLKPVLMKGAKAEVKTPYYLIEDNGQAIFTITPGKNGFEFNKNLGYFSSFPGMQTHQCLYGHGIFIIQQNDLSGEAKEFKVVRLNPGRQLFVPAGLVMCCVNTGNSYLVVVRNSSLDKKYINSKTILKKHSFAYYVIAKKGDIGFEQNPNYLVFPQITMDSVFVFMTT